MNAIFNCDLFRELVLITCPDGVSEFAHAAVASTDDQTTHLHQFDLAAFRHQTIRPGSLVARTMLL